MFAQTSGELASVPKPVLSHLGKTLQLSKLLFNHLLCFPCKGKLLLVLCTWQTEAVSWAVTSVLHNARSGILKGAG